MSEKIRHPSAGEWLEELRAEEKLAQMDLVEDLAVLVETEECRRLRRQLADRYRSLIGVDPQHREGLRSAMQRVRAGGGMPVQDVVDLINMEHYGNGPV